MRRFFIKVQNAIAFREQHEDEGATMVEYGLMVALVAVVAMLAVTALGNGVSATFNDIAGHL